MLFAARFVSVTLAFAAAAAGQAARFAHTGRVFDEQRKPVAKAQVTFVGASVCEGIDESDVVRVDGDDEGRFRAQLQPGRAYIAWAAVAADGGFVVSPAIDVGTLPCELVVDTKVPNRLRVAQLDAWRALGPLRVELEPNDCAGLVVRGPLDDDGSMALPALPTTLVTMRVFAKDVLVHKLGAKTHESFAMPPPQRLRVRVVDEQDQPVAGATVARVLWQWPWREAPLIARQHARRWPVATTGDDGTAEVLLAGTNEPLGDSPEQLVLHATREERGDGVAGVNSGPFVDDKFVAVAGLNGVLPIHLRKPRTIRVRTKGDAPAFVQLTGPRRIPFRTSWTEITDCRRAPIRGGALTLGAPWGSAAAGVEPWDQCMLEIPWSSPGLAADDPWQRSERSLPLVLPVSALAQDELDLREVVPLRLQVLDATAGPAIGARVLCSVESASEFVLPHRALQVFADRSGRVVLPVIPGKWFVMAVLDTTIAYDVIDVAPALGPRTLQLRPLDCMRVRVVDGAGKPLANAKFTLDHAPSGPAPRTALERLLYVAGSQVSMWAVRRCFADANGNADVRFLADTYPNMSLRVHADGRSTTVSAEARTQRLEIVVK